MSIILPRYVTDRFALDFRSLALFRIALTLLLLAEFCWNGMVISERLASPLFYPAGWLALSIGLVAFGLGYRTRLAALFLWLAYAIFHIVQGERSFHSVICAMLIFSVFLPLGRFVSLDDAMDRGAVPDGQRSSVTRDYRSVATAGVVVFALYYFIATAVNAYATVLYSSLWMLGFALLLVVASVLPRSWEMVRFLIVACAGGGAFLQGLYMIIQGSSPVETWLLVVFATLQIPGAGWSILNKIKRFRARHGIRIYYDEPCGFCRKICYVFASFLMLGRCQIATAQSNDAAHTLLRDNDSWVVYDENGNHALCWAALLVLMRASPVWWSLGWLLTSIGMGSWGTPIYRLIGRSRNLLSKLTVSILPYDLYRSRLRSYEVWIVGIWCLILIAHFAGLLSTVGVGLPEIASLFGFGSTVW